MSVEALTPEALRAVQGKGHHLPDAVVESVNELLIKYGASSHIVIKQKEIEELVVTRLGVSAQVIYAEKWMDFEPVFRDAGWDVYYDKPAYCETYEPTFTFTKRKP